MAEIGYGRAIFRSGPRVWGAALLELVVVTTISLIPLLGAAVREILPTDSKIYLSDAFARAFLSGQLLFYALGLTATVIWQCNRDFRSFSPLRILFNLYGLFCIGMCTLIIGVDPDLHAIRRDVLAPISIVIFGTSLIAYVLMAVIAKVHVNVGKAIARSDAALGDAVRRSRGLKP